METWTRGLSPCRLPRRNQHWYTICACSISMLMICVFTQTAKLSGVLVDTMLPYTMIMVLRAAEDSVHTPTSYYIVNSGGIPQATLEGEGGAPIRG